MQEPSDKGDVRVERTVRRCWLFHDWAPWEQYIEKGQAIGGLLSPMAGKSYSYTEQRQRRVCKRCNYMQDELISG